MKNPYIFFFLLLSFSLSSQIEIDEEITLPSKRPYDYEGIFCKSITIAKMDLVEIPKEKMENWANSTVLEWLKYNEIEITESKTKSHHLHLMYEAFHKCEEFRNYYHLIYDSNSQGQDELETQHVAFADKFCFLNKRGFRVLPAEYKAFENMEVYKKNLRRYDWVMSMDTKYLGDKKYQINYFLFDSHNRLAPSTADIKLMTVDVEFHEGEILHFHYTEYPKNVKKASTYMQQVFGTPPPPPSPR